MSGFVPLYCHADGRDFDEVEDNVRKFQEQGYRYIRCQVAVPGLSTYGSRSAAGGRQTWEFTPYARIVPRLFERLRGTFGDQMELLHDIHERLPPIQAIGLAKRAGEVQSLFPRRPVLSRR